MSLNRFYFQSSVFLSDYFSEMFKFSTMPYRLPTQSVIQIYFDISLREEKLHCLEKQTNEKLGRVTEEQSIS